MAWRRIVPIVVAWVLVGACHGGPVAPVTAGPAQWASARAIAERWATARGGGPASIETPHPRMPFLFEVGLPDVGLVLVHDGAVSTATGPEALGRYLDEAHLYAAQELTVDDVLELVHLFRALPPVDPAEAQPDQYDTDDAGPRAIAFAWRDHQLELTLSYLMKSSADGDDEDEGDAGGSTLRIARWTLVLAAGTTPAWREERRDFDPVQQRFVP